MKTLYVRNYDLNRDVVLKNSHPVKAKVEANAIFPTGHAEIICLDTQTVRFKRVAPRTSWATVLSDTIKTRRKSIAAPPPNTLSAVVGGAIYSLKTHKLGTAKRRVVRQFGQGVAVVIVNDNGERLAHRDPGEPFFTNTCAGNEYELS